MRGKAGRRIAFGLVICLLVWAGTAAAGGLHTEVVNPELKMEVQLGYDGQITYGKAIPVRVTVRNDGGDLEGTLAVNGYVNTQKYDRFETEISIPAGGERTVVLPVVSSTKQDLFTAEIVKDGKVICAVNKAVKTVINPGAMMIGVLSTRPRNLANLDITQENDILLRYEYWQTVALTPETLPEDPELLKTFGMIVLDDMDPALLTEKQQDALKNWITAGHVLIVGGGMYAPQNLAFLGELTNLRVGDFTVSDSVSAAVEAFAGQRNSGRKTEVALAKTDGADPLVSDADGNGLVWRETAGAGRIITLAWEAGNASLNAESAMHVFFQQLMIKTDPTLYSSIMYSGGSFQALYAAGEDTGITVRNSLPVAAAVIAAAALMGCALWAILKKRGQTQWMWAVIPVLAIAVAAVVTVMAGSSPLNRPVTATTVNLVQDTDGNITRFVHVTAAAPRTGLHRFSMEGENLEPQMYDEGYYWMDEDDEAAQKEPAQLRSVRISGKNREAAVNSLTPWKLTQLTSVRTDEETGKVDGSIWMEDDGLHGIVRNGLFCSLKKGVVYCSTYGFVRIPALEPGESAEFAMIAEDAKDPSAPVFENGKMLRNVAPGAYMTVYQMMEGWGQEGYDSYGSRESMLYGMMNSAADYLTNNQGNGRENTIFMYSAEPEGDFAAPVLVDGEKAEGRAVLPMFSVQLNYLKTGKTGVVFHAPGMDKPVRCEIDGAGLPKGDWTEDAGSGKYGYRYYVLAERPTFRFTLDGLDQIRISRISIGMDQWYMNDMKCYVLNHQLKTWVEIKPNAALSYPEQYLDGQGNLYCQFRPLAGDSYMEIPEPTLTIEGKLKEGGEEHAEP